MGKTERREDLTKLPEKERKVVEKVTKALKHVEKVIVHTTDRTGLRGSVELGVSGSHDKELSAITLKVEPKDYPQILMGIYDHESDELELMSNLEHKAEQFIKLNALMASPLNEAHVSKKALDRIRDMFLAETAKMGEAGARITDPVDKEVYKMIELFTFIAREYHTTND